MGLVLTCMSTGWLDGSFNGWLCWWMDGWPVNWQTLQSFQLKVWLQGLCLTGAGWYLRSCPFDILVRVKEKNKETTGCDRGLMEGDKREERWWKEGWGGEEEGWSRWAAGWKAFVGHAVWRRGRDRRELDCSAENSINGKGDWIKKGKKERGREVCFLCCSESRKGGGKGGQRFLLLL